jgi:hypothetical protein
VWQISFFEEATALVKLRQFEVADTEQGVINTNKNAWKLSVQL